MVGTSLSIKTVTVLGANGTMGRNVAALFASFGGAKVYMVCRDPKASSEIPSIAASSVKASSVSDNLFLVGYDRLEECVSESDLVFESVSENLAAKMDVWSRVGKCLGTQTLACTGTSGLSVNQLASVLPQECREQFSGMHFFNPPYAMRLCELCPSSEMGEQLVNSITAYLEMQLRRVVVLVSDTAAFLGNRIGFEFINRSMQLAAEYASQGGVDYIDSILGPFTGRAMAPLNTADFVGLDVHKAIVDNVFSSDPNDLLHEAFALPAFCQHLVLQGNLGRKAKGKGGLFFIERQEDGVKRRLVYDIESQTYRETRRYQFDFVVNMLSLIRVGDYAGAFRALIQDRSEESRLCGGMLLEYIVYSVHTSQLVSGDESAADDVMGTGFNWCPPLALVDGLRSAGELESFVDAFTSVLPRGTIDALPSFDKLPASRYDFRRFFRAIR